jgi:hypothetical protein
MERVVPVRTRPEPLQRQLDLLDQFAGSPDPENSRGPRVPAPSSARTDEFAAGVTPFVHDPLTLSSIRVGHVAPRGASRGFRC